MGMPKEQETEKDYLTKKKKAREIHRKIKESRRTHEIFHTIMNSEEEEGGEDWTD